MPQPNDRARRRGASRKAQATRRGLRLPFGLLKQLGVVALLMSSMGLCWVYGAEVVARIMNRPIAKVTIEGEFKFIEKAEVAEMLAARINKEFIQLNLEEIKQQLEAQPWISSVDLTRRWPDQLFVRVEEQQPIARWADIGFINQRGELVRVPMTDYLLTLPQVSGAEGMAEQMMQTYLALNKMLRPKALEVASLTSDEKKAWDLRLSNGIRVRLGHDELFAKLQRVLLVYEQELKQRAQDVDVIDARYQQGVAVAWKKPELTQVVGLRENIHKLI